MTSLINRRVRTASMTIVVLAFVALLFVPSPVLSIAAGGGDNPLLPAPPAFQLAPREPRDAAAHDARPGRVDSVDARLQAGSRSARESVEHHVEDLPGDVLIDEPSLELTQVAGSFEDGGPLGGFDFSQHGHLPLLAADNASGFPRGSQRFLGAGGFGAAGGGSGAAGGGGSAASGGESGAANGGVGEAASNDGGSAREPESVEPLPKVEDGNVDVNLGLPNLEVPSPDGDGAGSGPPPIGGPGDPSTPISVPEPSSFLLTGLGVAALVARQRRASRAASSAAQA